MLASSTAPPRRLRITRPQRESSRLRQNSIASPTISQISTNATRGSASDQPPIAGAGMFASPACPPSTSMLPNSIAIDRPQAIVLSGRKCPPSRNVNKPIASADTPVISSAAGKASQGDRPCAVHSHALA